MDYEQALPSIQAVILDEPCLKRCKIELGLLSGNIAKLECILDGKMLANELEVVNEDGKMTNRLAFSSSDTGDMVSLLVEQNDIQNFFETYLHVTPDGDLLSCLSGGILFQRLIHSTKALPTLVAEMEKVKILHRALQWEMCRSLIVVFDWYTSTGREFAQWLLQIHQQGGYKALKLQSPPFADIVDHIVQYVQESQDAAREGKRTSKQKAKSAKRTVAAGKPPRKPPTMPETPQAKIGPVQQQL